MIGDMSNETLAKLAMNFNNGLLPKHIIEAGPGSFAENIVNSMMLHQLTETNNRLASLEKALKERPVSSTTIDQNGIVSKSELRNGLIRVTRKPNAPLNNF
jgi:hypothetical protein